MVGENVRLERTRLSMTQEELADRASMDPAEIRRIESGRRDAGTRVLTRIADGLGVPTARLFRGVGKVAKQK